MSSGTDANVAQEAKNVKSWGRKKGESKPEKKVPDPEEEEKQEETQDEAQEETQEEAQEGTEVPQTGDEVSQSEETSSLSSSQRHDGKKTSWRKLHINSPDDRATTRGRRNRPGDASPAPVSPPSTSHASSRASSVEAEGTPRRAKEARWKGRAVVSSVPATPSVLLHEDKPRMKSLREARLAQEAADRAEAKKNRTAPGGVLHVSSPDECFERLHNHWKKAEEHRAQKRENLKREEEERDAAYIKEFKEPVKGSMQRVLAASERLYGAQKFYQDRLKLAQKAKEKEEANVNVFEPTMFAKVTQISGEKRWRGEDLYQDHLRRTEMQKKRVEQFEQAEVNELLENSVHKEASKTKSDGSVKRGEKLYVDAKMQLESLKNKRKKQEEEEVEMLKKISVHSKFADAPKETTTKLFKDRTEKLYEEHSRRLQSLEKQRAASAAAFPTSPTLMAKQLASVKSEGKRSEQLYQDAQRKEKSLAARKKELEDREINDLYAASVHKKAAESRSWSKEDLMQLGDHMYRLGKAGQRDELLRGMQYFRPSWDEAEEAKKPLVQALSDSEVSPRRKGAITLLHEGQDVIGLSSWSKHSNTAMTRHQEIHETPARARSLPPSQSENSRSRMALFTGSGKGRVLETDLPSKASSRSDSLDTPRARKNLSSDGVERAALSPQERKNLKTAVSRKKTKKVRRSAAARALAALDPDAQVKSKPSKKATEEKASVLPFAPPERRENTVKADDYAAAQDAPRIRKPKQREPMELRPEVIQRLRSKIKSAAYASSGDRNMSALFAKMDRDRSGFLDPDELKSALRRVLRIPPEMISEEEFSALFHLFDTNDNGQIELAELTEFVGEDAEDDLAAFKKRNLAKFKERPVQQELPAEVLQQLKSKIASAAYLNHNGRQLEVLFRRMDKDRSGFLDDDELKSCVRRVFKIPPETISDGQISQLCATLDADKSGRVELEELMNFVGPDPVLSDVYKDMLEMKSGKLTPELKPEALEMLSRKIKSAAYINHNGRQLEVLFSRLDKDRSGSIEDEEFKYCIRHIFKIPPSSISDAEMSLLCTMLDTDKSGTIELEELINFVGPDPDMAATWKEHLPLKSGKLTPDLTPEVLEKIKSKIKSAAYTKGGRQLEALFARMDKDRSGHVDDDEFKSCIRRVFQIPPETISDEEILQLSSMLDTDKSGQISLEELRGFVGSDPKNIPNYEEYILRKKTWLDPGAVKSLKSKIKSAAYVMHDGLQLEQLFNRMDKDGSGHIDEMELRLCVRRYFKMPPSKISDEEVSLLYSALDSDDSGLVDLEELVKFIGPEPVKHSRDGYYAFTLTNEEKNDGAATARASVIESNAASKIQSLSRSRQARKRTSKLAKRPAVVRSKSQVLKDLAALETAEEVKTGSTKDSSKVKNSPKEKKASTLVVPITINRASLSPANAAFGATTASSEKHLGHPLPPSEKNEGKRTSEKKVGQPPSENVAKAPLDKTVGQTPSEKNEGKPPSEKKAPTEKNLAKASSKGAVGQAPPQTKAGKAPSAKKAETTPVRSLDNFLSEEVKSPTPQKPLPRTRAIEGVPSR
mmetsp:Transcript_15098/g.26426  ORF Transcript_15098/g.26426 Transcript_15098/m.26426 type:complete len:1561 (-) Transcript_15098:132-4814(-)